MIRPASVPRLALRLCPIANRAGAGAAVVIGVGVLAGVTSSEAAAATGDILAAANDTFTFFWRQTGRALDQGYQMRPALMVGLAGLVVLPVLVILGALARSFSARTQPNARSKAAVLDALSDQMPGPAWLEFEPSAGGAPRVEIARELVQIGREDDNDICIPDDTVHRYHALIECTRDNGFVIVDVSGPDGNGVRVNGERRIKSSLADGDVVEIGQAKLRFASAA